jgi:hypothetical protein
MAASPAAPSSTASPRSRGAAAATALLPLLENNYARAETVPESDPRLVAEMIDIPGSAPGLKGYLAKPKDGQKFPPSSSCTRTAA